MSLSYTALSNKLSVEIGIGKHLRDDNNLLHELLDERDELIEKQDEVIEHLKLIIKRRELN